jgi:hypothetical protein
MVISTNCPPNAADLNLNQTTDYDHGIQRDEMGSRLLRDKVQRIRYASYFLRWLLTRDKHDTTRRDVEWNMILTLSFMSATIYEDEYRIEIE